MPGLVGVAEGDGVLELQQGESALVESGKDAVVLQQTIWVCHHGELGGAGHAFSEDGVLPSGTWHVEGTLPNLRQVADQ